MKRKIILLLLFSLLLPVLLEAVPPLRKIRVGYFQNEPIIFQDQQGSPQGLYADLLREIARQQNWQLEFVFGSWAECIKRMQTGDIDLMTSIALTEERQAFLQFSKENLLTMWGQVFVKEARKIDDILALSGLQIAILKDGINGINFKKLAKAFGINFHVIEVDSYEQAVKLVVAGKADGFVANNIHGYRLMAKYDIEETPVLFNPFKLRFAVSRTGDSGVLETVDEYLSSWKADKNSFYYDRVKYWYQTQEPAVEIIPKWFLYGFATVIVILTISIFWLNVLLVQIRQRKKAEREKGQVITELQSALSEIETLEGILPICASCKKIRDDDGGWNFIENYICDHSRASFSHSLCPECSDRLYGKEEWYAKVKKKD